MASQLQPTYPVMLTKVPPKVKKTDIETYLSKYGPIVSVSRYPDNKEKGCFVFYVNFETEEASIQCSQQIAGTRITPKRAPARTNELQELQELQERTARTATNCKNLLMSNQFQGLRLGSQQPPSSAFSPYQPGMSKQSPQNSMTRPPIMEPTSMMRPPVGAPPMSGPPFSKPPTGSLSPTQPSSGPPSGPPSLNSFPSQTVTHQPPPNNLSQPPLSSRSPPSSLPPTMNPSSAQTRPTQPPMNMNNMNQNRAPNQMQRMPSPPSSLTGGPAGMSTPANTSFNQGGPRSRYPGSNAGPTPSQPMLNYSQPSLMGTSNQPQARPPMQPGNMGMQSQHNFASSQNQRGAQLSGPPMMNQQPSGPMSGPPTITPGQMGSPYPGSTPYSNQNMSQSRPQQPMGNPMTNPMAGPQQSKRIDPNQMPNPTCPYRHTSLQSDVTCPKWSQKRCQNKDCSYKHPPLTPRDEKEDIVLGEEEEKIETADQTLSNLSLQDEKPKQTTPMLQTPSQLEEINQCPICLELANNPYILPCKHLFCKECLDELVDFESSKDPTIQCPSCRVTHQLVSDIKQWEAPFNLRQTIDYLLRPVEHTEVCDTKGCESNQDLSYCKEEKKILCKKCCSQLNPFYTFYNLQYSFSSNTMNAYCKTHDSFQNNICNTCGVLCCMYCLNSSHEHHFTMHLDAFNNMNQTSYTSKKKDLSDLEESIDDVKSEIDKTMSNLKNEQTRIKDVIKRNKQTLIFHCIYMLNSIEEEINKNIDNEVDSKKALLDVALKLADHNQEQLTQVLSRFQKYDSSSSLKKYLNWNTLCQESDETILKLKDSKPDVPDLCFTEKELDPSSADLFRSLQSRMDLISYNKQDKPGFDNQASLCDDHVYWRPKEDFDLCIQNNSAMNEYLKQSFYSLVNKDIPQENLESLEPQTKPETPKKKKQRKKKKDINEKNDLKQNEGVEKSLDSLLDIQLPSYSVSSNDSPRMDSCVAASQDNFLLDYDDKRSDESDTESTGSSEASRGRGSRRRNRNQRGGFGRGRGRGRGNNQQRGGLVSGAPASNQNVNFNQHKRGKNYRQLNTAESMPTLSSASLLGQPTQAPMPYCHKCKTFGHLTKLCKLK